MSLTQDAVQEISKLAVAAIASDYVSGIPDNVPAVILPDGYKLQSLDDLQESPSAFKGVYETNDISEFVDYVSSHANLTNSVVFINPDKMSATAVIDHGTKEAPQWGKHKALLELTAEPEYKDLLQGNNNPFTQLNFIDFIQDYKDAIEFIGADGVGEDYKESLRSFRTLTIESINNETQKTGDFSASRSELESIDIKGAGRELPWGFTFTCIPYAELERFTFTAQLRAVKQGSEVLLKYRLYQYSVVKKAITDSFKSKLNHDLNAYAATYIGQFKR